MHKETAEKYIGRGLIVLPDQIDDVHHHAREGGDTYETIYQLHVVRLKNTHKYHTVSSNEEHWHFSLRNLECT
jgi:hypothetical protein